MFNPCEICGANDWTIIYEGDVRAGSFGSTISGKVARCGKCGVARIDESTSISALDYENNLLLREHLQKYYLSHKPTIILVTHNIEEAVHLASKIIVLSKKPAKVAEIIENPIDYPRNLQTLKKEEFHLVKDKVLLAFQKAANL